MKSKDAVNNFLKSAGSKAGCKQSQLTSIEENSELSSGSSEPTVVRPLGALGALGSQRSVSSMSTQSTSSPSMGSSASKRTSRASSELPSLGNFCLVLSEKLLFTEWLCFCIYLKDSFCYKHLLSSSQNNTINTAQ